MPEEGLRGCIDVEDHGTTHEGRADGERVGTIFLIKEDEEYCFLFERDKPGRLYATLFESAESGDTDLSCQEVLEMIEGMVPHRLRSI
jgi:hypothetical protein